MGRLNIGGSRFCTGTLISPSHVLTAAHCLYDPRTLQRVPDSMLHFVSGLNRGAHVAARRVASSHVLPDYRYTGRVTSQGLALDIAILTLAQPIAVDAVRPLPMANGTTPGAPLSVVSYSVGRPHAPSLETGSRMLGRAGDAMVMDFTVAGGASGAPVMVMQGGAPRLLGIVSASATANGRKVALTVPVAPLLERLLRAAQMRTAGL